MASHKILRQRAVTASLAVLAALAWTIGGPALPANADATACEGDGAGPPVLLAAGVVAIGEVDAYGFDGVGGMSIDVWPQKAPDTHRNFSWMLRDRATGAVFAEDDAVEVPFPQFHGPSPYEDLCLEVTTFQSFVTQYSIIVTADV
jgi:hypothetical protein